MDQCSLRRSAKLSPCGRYRYLLRRSWLDLFAQPDNYVLFICLNPSTADANIDDPTVRRCMGFARSWGYSGVVLANLFAFRATDPKKMLSAPDPVGPDNDRYLVEAARVASLVVAGWGVHGTHKDRAREVRSLVPGLHYLRLTKGGHPAHPLFLPHYLRPISWKNR